MKSSPKASSPVGSEPAEAITYRFADFLVDLSSRTVLKNGERVFVTPKAFDTLAVLLEHAGEVVDKHALMDVVWHDANVEEGNLSQNIFVLRKLLGEGARDNRFIATVPGRGYRFVASLQGSAPPAMPSLAESAADSQADNPTSSWGTWKWPVAAVAAVAVALSGYLVVARGGDSGVARSAPVSDDLSMPATQTSHSTDRAAYQAYLKGRYFWNKRTIPDLEHSIDYFKDALVREPSYALAYAGLADSYAMLGRSADTRIAARRALAIDSTLAAPHASLGNIALFTDWNWNEAGSELRTAIAQDPSYTTAHHWYAYYCAATGHVDEAVREMQRAIDLDPLSLILATDLGHMFYLASQYDRAIDQFRRVIEMDRNFPMAHSHLGETYLKLARFDDAAAEFRKMGTDALLPTIEALSDRPRAAERLRILAASENRIGAYHFALLMSAVGARADALEQLERARKRHEPEVVLLTADPAFEALRDDPRFQALVLRTGLPRD